MNSVPDELATPLWTAEHRSADGRHILVLVAHSRAELGIRLETARTAEP